MLLLIVRIVFIVVCMGAILAYVSAGLVGFEQNPPGLIGDYRFASFLVLLLLSQLSLLVDVLIPRKRIEVVSAIYFGLLVGALLAYVLIQALTPVIQWWEYQTAVMLLITLMVPYFTISLLLQTKDDFRFIIPFVEFARELKGRAPWILDSSALIDGRIADVVETNVIDTQLMVPQFVLHEVQEIADSNDKMRRTRGRRGLDVLNRLQNNPRLDVKVRETTRGEYDGMNVDQRLVEIAKKLGGRIVTNDFNLNRVASVQGIDVINLNDLANALKPRYLPGERLRIRVIKEGESEGQGVGYLDDGTMVVCEQSSQMVGKDIDLTVTSVLQSSAGRMIFGKPARSPQSNN